MTDWREHNGGPQPVADDVWVGVWTPPNMDWWDIETMPAKEIDWNLEFQWCVLNQHLIDAARLEGIRLGLEAALKEAVLWVSYKQGDRIESAVRRLNPETIAREAVLDQLTREAQAENMGYDND